MRKISYGLLIGASLSVGACSIFGFGSQDDTTGTNAAVVQASQVETSGIGEDSTIVSSHRPRVSRLSAPAAHTYHFAFDNSVVQSIDKPSLDAQAAYLRRHPKARILLAGHTDERGSREYNVALGERRAHSVERYLLAHGVKRNQFRDLSYGKEKLVAFGHNESAHRKNRRVELTYEDTGR